jgi:hypothetical protein
LRRRNGEKGSIYILKGLFLSLYVNLVPGIVYFTYLSALAGCHRVCEGVL